MCVWGGQEVPRDSSTPVYQNTLPPRGPHSCMSGWDISEHAAAGARGQRQRETQTFMGLCSVGTDTQQKDNWPQMQTLARPS